MLGLDLVRPLEDDWQDSLDQVARKRGWPTSRDARLVASVAALSAAYNDPSRASAMMSAAGPARLGFSFPRDVPKGAAAVREVIASGALAAARPGGGASSLRVLDIGAGLGAMTWGLARALDASRARVRLDALWVDTDADALAVAQEVVATRGGNAGGVQIAARVRRGSLDALPPALAGEAPFDVVLAGQILSELDVHVENDLRVVRHAAHLRSLLDAYVAPQGFLVVVEPALRDRTRHLHRVRDAVATIGTLIFAPCLHAGSCGALTHPGDWCHEDLPIDVPPWIVPLARAAGLRYQGLTFSYLVLRKSGITLASLLPVRDSSASLRVVSNRRITKGKSDVFLCGALSSRPRGDEVTRVAVTRLDRDETARNEAWESMRRGDILLVDPAPEPARSRTHGENHGKALATRAPTEPPAQAMQEMREMREMQEKVQARVVGSTSVTIVEQTERVDGEAIESR